MSAGPWPVDMLVKPFSLAVSNKKLWLVFSKQKKKKDKNLKPLYPPLYFSYSQRTFVCLLAVVKLHPPFPLETERKWKLKIVDLVCSVSVYKCVLMNNWKLSRSFQTKQNSHHRQKPIREKHAIIFMSYQICKQFTYAITNIDPSIEHFWETRIVSLVWVLWDSMDAARLIRLD